MAIKLLIADDDSLIRESLKIIIGLDKDFDILATVSNGKAALEFCIENLVDVALLDVRMPVMNGVEAVKEITEKTDTKCLILTTFDEDDYIKDAVSFGAKGYILKNNEPDKIKNAIKVVFNGSTVMQDVVMEKIKEGFNKPSIDTSLFTERELSIMKAISEGLSNRQVASKLFISEGTVKNYISNILGKTALEHRTQLAIYYLKGKL